MKPFGDDEINAPNVFALMVEGLFFAQNEHELISSKLDIVKRLRTVVVNEITINDHLCANLLVVP